MIKARIGWLLGCVVIIQFVVDGPDNTRVELATVYWGAAYHSLKSMFGYVCCHSVTVRIEDNAVWGLVTVVVTAISSNSNDLLSMFSLIIAALPFKHTDG